jgi:hypothetical protein
VHVHIASSGTPLATRPSCHDASVRRQGCESPQISTEILPASFRSSPPCLPPPARRSAHGPSAPGRVIDRLSRRRARAPAAVRARAEPWRHARRPSRSSPSPRQSQRQPRSCFGNLPPQFHYPGPAPPLADRRTSSRPGVPGDLPEPFVIISSPTPCSGSEPGALTPTEPELHMCSSPRFPRICQHCSKALKDNVENI